VRVLLFAAALAACGGAGEEPAAHHTYDEDGIRFDYPPDWSVATSEAEDAVTVEGPRDGIFVVQRFRGAAKGLEEFSRDFLAKELTDAFADAARASAVTSEVAGARREGLRTVFSLGRGLSFALEVYRIEFPAGAVFLVSQSTADDERLNAGAFGMIRRSFRVAE